MVLVRYHRPGKNTREWEQRCILDAEEVVISSFVFELSKPFILKGSEIIKTGYTGILYDPFDRWYNVLEVYARDRRFVGYYSDIRTPPKRIIDGYEATDLVLDLWVTPEGEYAILDQDEFEKTELKLDHRIKAEETMAKLIDMVREGKYPPNIVKKYSKSIQ